MPRKLNLESHLSVSELKDSYRNATDPVESRRFHLIWLLAQGGYTIKSAAETVGLNYDYAYEIVQRYNRQGASGLANGRKHNRAPSPKALLNPTQCQELQEALKHPPEDGGVWNGPKVARWIERKTGREKVCPQQGWVYLKRLNYSWQRPRPHHAKADKQAQADFKKKLPELKAELQQKYPEATVSVWAFDEHRVGLKPILRKVWSPIAQRPIAVVCHRYEWVYLYGLVNPKTGENEWLILPRVNVEWFNQALKVFAEMIGASATNRIILVLDGAGWHRSERVEVPEGIHLEILPPYSPELQPAERLWSVADEPLVNRSFESIEELEEVLAGRCVTMTTMMQEEIKALTHYHWWA